MLKNCKVAESCNCIFPFFIKLRQDLKATVYKNCEYGSNHINLL